MTPLITAAPQLSRRETETMLLIAKGFGDKQIAARMNVSSGSVHEYLRRMRRKIGVCNRVRIALYAVKIGAINIDDISFEDLAARH